MSGAAAFLAVVALLAAARQLPRSLRTEHARVEADAGRSAFERELAPARYWRLNARLLLRADRILPPHTVYSVAVGRRQELMGVPLFYGYWLLPRRRAKHDRGAQWIVLWGKDRSRLAVKTDVVANVGAGAQVLRVRR
jgi:hypothetical protein